MEVDPVKPIDIPPLDTPAAETSNLAPEPNGSVKSVDVEMTNAKNEETKEEESISENEDLLLIQTTINVLEKQLEKAVKDIKRLEKAKEKALNDPKAFIKAIRHKQNLDIPSRQIIASIPDIDISRYIKDETMLSVLTNFNVNSAQMIRELAIETDKKLFSGISAVTPTSATDISIPHNPITTNMDYSLEKDYHNENVSAFLNKVCTKEREEKNHEIRSRLSTRTSSILSSNIPNSPLYDELGPPWTDDENRILATQLHACEQKQIAPKFMYAHISQLLRTRTPSQVAARIEKFIIKLKGLEDNMDIDVQENFQPEQPVVTLLEPPQSKLKKTRGRRKSHHNIELIPNVTLPGKAPKAQEIQTVPTTITSEIPIPDSSVPVIQNNPINPNISSAEIMQKSNICDGCKADPIVGSKWSCVECAHNGVQVGLCEACVAQGDFKNEIHDPASHVFEKKED